jgi:Lar family restriction alleviation protein
MGGTKMKLLPCPFCGNKTILPFSKDYELLDYTVYLAKCDECGATTGNKCSEKEAVLAWNIRYEKGKGKSNGL